jgi:hypothetical protein
MDFDPRAPYAGCRLCGAIYQTELDRQSYQNQQDGLITIEYNALYDIEYYSGAESAIKTYNEATERRTRWREIHRKRYHTDEEVERFTKTGYALTPQAAHKLAPYGFAPMGNLHEEIVDAMATAPRAPLDDAEY